MVIILQYIQTLHHYVAHLVWIRYMSIISQFKKKQRMLSTAWSLQNSPVLRLWPLRVYVTLFPSYGDKKLQNREQHLSCCTFTETWWPDLNRASCKKTPLLHQVVGNNPPCLCLTLPLKMPCWKPSGSSGLLRAWVTHWAILLAWPWTKPFSAPNSNISGLFGLTVYWAQELAFNNNSGEKSG